MTQANPSNMLFAQAMHVLNGLRRQISAKKYKTSDEITEIINQALTRFEETAGKALTEYDPIYKSEVPNSAKMNRFWNAVQTDINLLQNEVDLLRAAAIQTHNSIKVDLLKSSNDTLRLQNKLKTLELYSSADNDSLIYIGDTFITEDQIDWNAISGEDNRIEIIGRQSVGLGIASRQGFSTGAPTVTILSGSNGMLGNNREIVDPLVSTQTNVLTGDKSYLLVSEMYASDDLKEIVDNQPNTWIEFEKYEVSSSDRARAKNYGFKFSVINNAKWSYMKSIPGSEVLYDWANGVALLNLNLELDLKVPTHTNIVRLLPFGLPDNKNNPIKVKKVSVSLNKTDWTLLNPQNLWIANTIDKKISNVNSENIIIGEATWTANGDEIRYIRFEIEQPQPIDVNIGHYYYSGEEEGTITISDTSFGTSSPIRMEGPIPSVQNPNQYIDEDKAGTLSQKMEYFMGKRWVIGIRDISTETNIYNETGTFVSKRFNIPGIIDRVALETEVEIPEDYDQSANWIEFYISPNDGANWFQISRIQDDFLDIPEIIAFNDPTPVELRESGVGYYDVGGAVNSLRFKAVFSRPSNRQYSTPILKPYKLKIMKRTKT